MADGSTSTTSNVAPRYVQTINVSQTAYTQICTIVGGSLASAVNMSFQGTSGSVVVNVTAQILVNHYQDISITTTSGFYSQLNLRVISNNNETYSVEAQVISGVGTTTDLNVEVFPLNSETVTFGGSPTTPGTTLVHTTRQGLYISASEGISISSTGNVGIGTTSPREKLSVSGNIELDDMPANGARWLLTNETNTGTGRLSIQAGGGSAAYGGGLSLFANAHATKPGWITAGISAGSGTAGTASEGRFTVNDQGVGGGTDIFTVLRTGNVGIGTTIDQATYPDIPSEHMMHITAPSTNAYYGGGISFGETAFTAANIVVRDAGSSGALDMCFGTGTSAGVTEKMRITNAGNVSIGNTNDVYKLDVRSTSCWQYFRIWKNDSHK
jgi:hypothetical protein